MYKIELDDNNIIRGKCFIDAPLEQIQKMGIPGPFVDNEVGRTLELPAEPIYEGKNIVGGVHRPDLIAPMTLELEHEPTVEEKIAVLENELRALRESINGEV